MTGSSMIAGRCCTCGASSASRNAYVGSFSAVTDGCCEAYGSEEVVGQPVITSGDTPEILEATEHALDGVSVAIEDRREAVLPSSIGLWRDVWHHAFTFDLTTDRIAIVAFVAMKHGCLRHLLKQQFAGSAVCDLTTCQHEGDRTTRTICQGVDFGGAPAARSADRLILLPPLPPDAQRCAFTAELSIRICAGGPPAAARISKISTQTPFAAHRTNRL